MNAIERILVIEDNPADARVVTEHLHEGFGSLHVSTAGSLAEAVALLRDETFAAVFCDLRLGDGEGVEAVARIRAATPDSALIVLTGNDDERVATDCLRAGAQDYLLKDHVSPGLLAWAVRNAASRKSAEDALLRSESNYRGLVENARFGIARVGPNRRVHHANPALARILDYPTAQSMIGIDLAELFDVPEAIASLEVAAPGELAELEVYWRRQSGSRALVRINGRRVNHGNEAATLELIVEDVTERRALEEELRQSQKMEAIGQLAGGIAHDLNNLLAIISADVQFVREALGPTSERGVGQAVDGIERAADRGASLIRQLLGFSRRQRLQPERIELGRVMEDIGQLAKRLLPRTIDLSLHRSNGSVWVDADRNAVEQILLNLITNARDALERGGTISVSCRADAPNRNGRIAILKVMDTGRGMDPEVRERAFEPFFSTKPAGAGTGLGLSTVYGLVSQMAGSIEIQSEPESGTAVEIRFPLQAAPAATRQTEKPDLESLRGCGTILLVEDEPELRRAARRLLERHGYEVLQAEDGMEGLARYRERADDIDVILTDVVMPRMGGVELFHALSGEATSVPIIFMSGYSSADLQRGDLLPSDLHLVQKPFDAHELLRTVRDTCGGTRDRRPADPSPVAASTIVS